MIMKWINCGKKNYVTASAGGIVLVFILMPYLAIAATGFQCNIFGSSGCFPDKPSCMKDCVGEPGADCSISCTINTPPTGTSGGNNQSGGATTFTCNGFGQCVAGGGGKTCANSGECDASNAGQPPQTQQSSQQSSQGGPAIYKLLQPLPGVGQTVSTFVEYVTNLIPFILMLAAVLAVVQIVIGGMEWAFSESILAKGEGKERITQALYGLLIALLSWLILNTINPDLVNLKLTIPGLPNTNTLGGAGTGGVGTGFPGKPCTNPSECASGICSGGFCDVSGSGATSLVACRTSTGGAQACYASMSACQDQCSGTCDTGGSGCTEITNQPRYVCIVNGMESSCTETQSECNSLCGKVGGSCKVANYSCQINKPDPSTQGCNAYTSETACSSNSQCRWKITPFNSTNCFTKSQQFTYVCGDNSGIIGCFDNQTSCDSYCGNFRTGSSNTGCYVGPGTCSTTNRPLPRNRPTDPNDCRISAGCPFPTSCKPPVGWFETTWTCVLAPLSEGAICTDTNQCQSGLTCKPPFNGNSQKRCFK